MSFRMVLWKETTQSKWNSLWPSDLGVGVIGTPANFFNFYQQFCHIIHNNCQPLFEVGTPLWKILDPTMFTFFFNTLWSSFTIICRSEYAMSTYSHQVHQPQVRRQHLVPYKPVYVIPQAYHYSLPRSSYTRVYRHPSNADSLFRHSSNAESYTLSRPPGRAQPIRIVPQQSQPIMARNFEEATVTHAMDREHYRQAYSLPRAQTSSFQTLSDDDIVIEAALEPPQNIPFPSRRNNQDLQEHTWGIYSTTLPMEPRLPPGVVPDGGGGAVRGGVEISPLPPDDDAQEADEWQEISLYMRRPSLEDVHRVRRQTTDTANNNAIQMRSNGIENTTTHSNVHSHHAVTTTTRTATTTNKRMPSHGQTIITNDNAATLAPPMVGQNYVYRTTIPRDPQPRQKPLPMIMVNDEAMQFLTRKHSNRMRTDRAVTRMSSDRVAIRPIVNRMTDRCQWKHYLPLRSVINPSVSYFGTS